MAVVIEQVRNLYGFSRGTQATLSVAQPLVAALAVAEQTSPERLLAVGGAALAGYVAVFAANDLLDTRLDRARFEHERADAGFDIDSAGARHPVARGLLPVSVGVIWVAALGTLTTVVTALISPLCLGLFLLAVLLQVCYCLLAKVTPYKCLLSGVMVAVGASVGAFAMPGGVDPVRLALLAVWMAAWEIGGRNIVNDMADVEEDVHLGIRTLPVVYGLVASARTAVVCLVLGAASAVALVLLTPSPAGPAAAAGCVLVSAATLVRPGLHLLRRPTPRQAMSVFNLATFHPPLVLGVLAFAPLLAP